MCFLLAFTASALWQLRPAGWTCWVRSNRRFLGLSFALSHFVHLGAIAVFWMLAPDQLATLVRPATWILGGLAYVLIGAMATTSFEVTARWIGPKAWAALHTSGVYYLWIIFANSYVSRALSMIEYLLPATLVIVAGLLRVTAWLVRRRAVPNHDSAGTMPLRGRGAMR